MARPKPTGWKARATWHGLSSPCRGDRGSRRADSGGLAAKKAQKAQKSDGGRRRTLDGFIGREEAHKSQKKTGQADNRGFFCATAEREMW